MQHSSALSLLRVETSEQKWSNVIVTFLGAPKKIPPEQRAGQNKTFVCGKLARAFLSLGGSGNKRFRYAYEYMFVSGSVCSYLYIRRMCVYSTCEYACYACGVCRKRGGESSLGVFGSFVECLRSRLFRATRWANMKSKWKSSTKGVARR